jgi:hypothetical protein
MKSQAKTTPKKRKADELANSHLTEAQIDSINQAWEEAPPNDPILILLKWNPALITANGPGNLILLLIILPLLPPKIPYFFIFLQFATLNIVQGQVVNHILSNGGEDPPNSGFIFHFQSYAALVNCRQSLRNVVPIAFIFQQLLCTQIFLSFPLLFRWQRLGLFSKRQSYQLIFKKMILFFVYYLYNTFLMAIK